MAKINNSQNNTPEILPHDLNTYLKVVGIACIGILTLFLLTKTINEAKSYTTIGEGSAETNRTISVRGHGEVSATPDLATFNWNVTEEGKTVEEAQSKAAEKSNKAIAYIKSQGITDGDISIQGFSTNEKYENKPCILDRSVEGIVAPCSSNSEVVGYTTYQSVEVKVRGVSQNDNKTGALIAAIGKFGVKTSQIYYSFDKPENLKAQARQAAILDARQQASVLAAQLGIKLGKVVGFDDTSYSMPYAYGSADMSRSAVMEKAVVPELPSGDKQTTSDVVVTYSIN